MGNEFGKAAQEEGRREPLTENTEMRGWPPYVESICTPARLFEQNRRRDAERRITVKEPNLLLTQATA